MIPSPHINASLMAPYLRPITGTWFRAMHTRFLATALHFAHTRIQVSRFGAGSVTSPVHPLVYLTENHHVALLEVNAVWNPPGTGIVIPSPVAPWAVLPISVQLNQVVDLTDTGLQTALDISAQELTGDWAGYYLRGLPGTTIKAPVGIAPTQTLGAALHALVNLQGFLTLSAKAPERQNLVVFPDKVSDFPSNFLEFTDPATGLIHRIP